MDFKQIQDLIKLVNNSKIGEVTVEQKDFKITIKQKEEQIIQAAVATLQQPLPMSLPQQAPPQTIPQVSTAEQPKAQEAANLLTIKSPMIGTFYRRPSPDKPDFVAVGDEVSPGKVVCVIEAMKLFNEIESEVKGKIVKVLVEDASPVEYDQPLFLVEPA
jgi:acetyl-CoA carboxylase biotin carboxyl carrier protein